MSDAEHAREPRPYADGALSPELLARARERGRAPAPRAASTPRREPRPVATIAILAGLVAAFAAEVYLLGSFDPSAKALYEIGGMQRDALRDGSWERLFVAALLHGGPIHLLMNGFALWNAGPLIERLAGRAWLFVIFAVGALGGSLCGAFFNGPSVVSIGASGAILGVFGAALVLTFRLPASAGRKSMQGALFRTVIFALLPLLARGSGIDGYAHLGGAIAGAIVAAPLVFVGGPFVPAGGNEAPILPKIGLSFAIVSLLVFVAAVARVALYAG